MLSSLLRAIRGVDAAQGRAPRRRRRPAGLVGLTAAAIGAAGLIAIPGASPAVADTDPQPPVTVPTVSADALPTVQINGIVHDQIIVGNRVYVAGEFTSARPAGAEAGTNETPRSNLLAYDVTTGELITSWAPALNAAGRALAVSADGTRIIVGGSFTQVDGVNRYRLAELDATTGALLAPAPTFDAKVSTLAVSGDTLYVGGIFGSAGGQPRTRLAAFSISTGALLDWAPTADGEVLGIVAPAGSGKVVVGGKFTQLNGVNWYGMGALDATTGANLPWAATSVIRNAGANAGIYSLSTDGAQVYGTGYTFNGGGGGGNFEGTFALSVADGSIVYVTGCRGDTYDATPVGGVLYHVGHPHDCSTIGGHPQTEPWTFQYATAQTTTADPGGRVNTGGNFNGRPAPEVLHWAPTLTIGTYSGLDQAAWSVAANNDYVVLGGEFPRVNAKGQQGLVRFAVRNLAPNKEGAQGGLDLTPTIAPLDPGRVRVSWRAAWDRDNARLTYEVMRGTPLASAQVIATLTNDGSWWNRTKMSFTDVAAPPGTNQTYRIRVRDALGNITQGLPASVDVPAGDGTTSVYREQVMQDGAQSLWTLNEASGTGAYDYINANDVTLGAAETRGTEGALVGDNSKSTTFAGTENVPGVASELLAGPQTFTVEAWFRTTTTTGGKIVGFGSSNTAQSSTTDRHVYMRNDGRIVFGVQPSNFSFRTLTSPTALNDGQWHQVVGTLGTDRGLELYVDGKRVGRDAATTTARNFSGYWRIGGDGISTSWPSRPTSRSIAGDIDEVAVYPTALPLDRVQQHFLASGRPLNIPVRPADAYGAAIWDGEPTHYWRLDEATGPNVLNTMTNEPGATATDGVVFGEPGNRMWPDGHSARLPGDTAQTIVATASEVNPTVYSVEAWFKTTTTTGGRIVGFGNSASGTSTSYDRHVWMADNGRLRYGIYQNNQTRIIESPLSYNDGQLHQVVVTQGSNGQRLYVDGAQVASSNFQTPQNYTGFWRVGTDGTWGGATSNNFAGTIDEVAIYPRVLNAATVGQHWAFGAPNQAPVAAFTSSCTVLACSFDGSGSADADGSIVSYEWQFGDGETGTGASPSHTYAAAGSYDVVLSVTDDEGAVTTVTHTVTVTIPPNEPPTAAFTSDCTNLACSFDGTGSADTDGTIASYAWQFGDGETGTGASPSHTYPAGGTFDVVLTVTDDDGDTATVMHSVTVEPPNQDPTAAFASECTNLECSFDAAASSDEDGTVASFAWDFGDGETGTGATPSHTFAAGGTYDVKLTVTDDDGATGTVTHALTVEPANTGPAAAFTSSCPALACSFDGSGSSDADGSIASYAWDFGDGETGTGASPSHTFAAEGAYTVTLTVTDDDGATGTVSHVVTVTIPNQVPTAAFTSDCPNLACTFDATGSSDTDGSVVSWAWTFGDGETATGPTPSHTYAAAGSYDVELTVTDDDGATDTVTHTVVAEIPNEKPVARFTSDGEHLAWSFDGTTSSDADGSVVSYAWTFGDGETGSGPAPSHTFAAAGSYDVELTVTDDDGATDTVTHTVSATTPPPNEPPTADFSASCVELVCSLDGTSSSDTDGTVASYAWAFGDGGSGTGATASHTYGEAGSYQVTLTVTDDDGATASTTKSVAVTGPPVATALAADGFGRTVASGFGTADLGGAWAFSGAGTSASVADGSGRASLPAGRTALLRLGSVSNLDTDVSHVVWTEGMPTGGGAYLSTIVRGTPAGDYRARVRVQATGAVLAGFVRGVGSTETAVGTAPTVPGLTYTAGMRLRVRAQAEGASPTTLRLKVWQDGTPEPTAWTVTTTDSTAGFQVAGSVGFAPFASGSATSATVVRYDDLTAATIGSVAPNQPPVAAFTSTCAGLTCTFDGSGSSDADGAVTGWAWAFGDAALGAGSTVSHTYPAGGTYEVTLTATDNAGATHALTHTVSVTPPPNQAPVAAFTSACNGLTCTFDGTGASDPDGVVAAHAWAFGDGGTATGATTTRTYAAAGTYTVTLTVTDDDGAPATITHDVTVTAAALLASDAFTRTVASGLGSADTGGAWSTTGSASVADGSGRYALAAGAQARARLAGVSSRDTDMTHTIWTEALPTGGGLYLGTTVRGTAGGDYRGRVRIQSTGAVTAQLMRVVGSTETTLAAANVTGLTYVPGMKLRIRVQAQGASPTTLRLKVWEDGTTEPTAWRVTTTDSTAGLQVAGSIGFDPYNSASATTPSVVRYDDLSAVAL
jgi:PKD repeat protein